MLIGPKLAGMTVTLNYCLRHWEEQWDVDIPLENNSNLGHLVLSKKKILLRIALAREVGLSNHCDTVQVLTSVRITQRRVF